MRALSYLQTQVKSGTTVLMTATALLPNSKVAETWKTGVVWNSVTIGERIYLNEIEIIKLETTDPEYQYHLKDHLGNVRLTFTTKEDVETNKATMEAANENTEYSQFSRYEDVRKVRSALFDHTNNTNPTSTDGQSIRLSGNANEKTGLVKTLSVMPGDVVHMKVYAKYVDRSKTDWSTALNNLITAVGAGQSGTVVDGSNYLTEGATPFPYTGLNGTNTSTGLGPKAYLNYLMFDRSYTAIIEDHSQTGFVRVTETARENGQTNMADLVNGVPHELLEATVTVKQAGYLYIYLSNEESSPVEVFFDDFEVVHTKGPVVQSEEYYPFGLSFNSYQRENSKANDFLYNGKERQDELGLDLSDYGQRMYDPVLLRFLRIDPFTDKYNSWSPYLYAANNPIRFIDYNGNGPGDAISGREIVKTFDDGKKAAGFQLTIYVDQPGTGHDRDTYEPHDPTALFNRDAGHTFVGLRKTNEDGSVTEKIFGWYPGEPGEGGVNPRTGDAENDRTGEKIGALQDDNGHEYDVSKSFDLSKEDFVNVLAAVLQTDEKTFNLNSNNCTNVGILLVRTSGNKIKGTKGIWSFAGISVGGGYNPGDLGEDLREDSESNKTTGVAKTADYNDDSKKNGSSGK